MIGKFVVCGDCRRNFLGLQSLAEEEQNVSHQSPYDEDEDSISRRVQSHQVSIRNGFYICVVWLLKTKTFYLFQSKFCKKNELEGQSQSSLSCQPMPAPNVSVNESFYDKSTDSLLTRLEMHKVRAAKWNFTNPSLHF